MDPLNKTDPQSIAETADSYRWTSFLQGFGRMEGKLDIILSQQAEQKKTAEDHENRIRGLENNKDEDHENRLRRLEQDNWKRLGGIALALGLIGAVPVLVALGVI